MARCGRNKKCRYPRASWWKQSLGVDWLTTGGSYSPEVLAYEARVIAAGGSLQSGDKAMLNTFQETLETASIWTKIKDCGFFLGGFAGSVVKLKSPAGIENLTYTNFISGDYNESSGLYASAENRKIATGFIPTSQGLSGTNISVGYFMTEPDASTNYFYVTDTKAAGVSSFVLGNTQTNISGATQQKNTARTTVPMWHALSINASRMNIIREYMNMFGQAVVPPAITPDTEISIFGCRNNGVNLFSKGRIAFYFIGEYLTQDEINTLHNAVKVALITKGRYAESNEMLAFGDSITFGANASVYTNRWALTLATSFGLRERNLGISGSRFRTDSTIAPGGYVRRAELLNYYNLTGGSKIIIQYGVNDILDDPLRTTTGTAASVSDYTTKLTTLCNELKAAGVPVANIQIGSPSFLGGTVSAAAQEAWAAGARAAAVATGVKYTDVYAYMRDNGGATLIDADNVHPVNAGHTAIRDAHLLAGFVS